MANGCCIGPDNIQWSSNPVIVLLANRLLPKLDLYVLLKSKTQFCANYRGIEIQSSVAEVLSSVLVKIAYGSVKRHTESVSINRPEVTIQRVNQLLGKNESKKGRFTFINFRPIRLAP